MGPWYRAGASRGSPPVVSPGDTIEMEVFDDAGNAQGTILLGVHGVKVGHHHGRIVEATFMGASDVYFHWWMNQGEGSPPKDRGEYHLCGVATKDCPVDKERPTMVHGERYRVLGRDVLGAKQVPWLSDRHLFEGYMLARGRFEALRALPPPTKKPAASPRTEATAHWGLDEEATSGEVDRADGSEGSSSSSDDGDMKARIKQLRAELKKAEGDAADRRRKRRDTKNVTRGKAAAKEKGKKKDKKRARKKESEDRDRDAGRRSGSVPPKKKKKKHKEKAAGSRREKRGSSGSNDSEGRSKGKKKKRKSHPDTSGESSSDETAEELFRAKRAAVPKEKAGDQDRGPFGGGPPVDFGDEDGSSSDGGSVFQKGLSVPMKSSQQKLLAYTNKYPGRLACRMLMKMEQACARGAEGPDSSARNKTPVVAMNHVLTILLPSLGAKVGLRSTRELKTLGRILDLLAGGCPSKAADVVAQRIKAVERATHETHWGAAQFLELIPPENSMLLEKDEEMFVTKEWLLEQKLRSYDRRGPGRDGGDGKGKAKGAKGKTKDKEKPDRGAWEKNDKGGKKPETK